MEEFVARNGATVLRAARRHSTGAADAEDAYQRAIEKLLTRAPELDEPELVAWTTTVAKNEALMIARRNSRRAAGDADAIVAETADVAPGPDELLVDREAYAFGRTALSRLREDQLRCLILRADGLSYSRIAELTGFSYAKVNRCLSEGRRSLRDAFERIESGADCRRFDSSLSLLADNLLRTERRAELEAHLSECLACQATLRMYRSAPSRVAAALPLSVAAIEAVQGAGGRLFAWVRSVGETVQTAVSSLQERLGGAIVLNHGAELVAAKKAVVVISMATSMVGGAVAVDRAISERDASRSPTRMHDQPVRPQNHQPLGPTPAPHLDGDAGQAEMEPKQEVPAEVGDAVVGGPPSSPAAPRTLDARTRVGDSLPPAPDQSPSFSQGDSGGTLGTTSDPSGEFAP